MNRLHYSNWRRAKTPRALFWIVAVVVGALSVSLYRAADARADQGRLATTAELHQMHDAGQYRICLQQISRVLRSSGNTGKGFDRYDLLLLRGDCLLHLQDPATAQLAYAAAAKSPVAEQARQGRAMGLLLRRCTKMKYAPRDEGHTGDDIDVADEGGRTEALRALLRDELRDGDPDFRRAMDAENLVPIRRVLPVLEDLYAVERTATGGDARLRPVLEAIGERARTLIDRELGLRDQRVAAVERRANQQVNAAVGSGWWGGAVRRGLHTDERRELRDLVDYLRQVEETANLGQQLAASFDADAMAWDPLIYRASSAARYAQDVLDAE